MSLPPKDKDLKGWLKRKGGRMNIWSRRWFVLSDKFLFVYLRDEDKKFNDCISLDGQIITEPAIDQNSNDPKKFYFDIVSTNSGVDKNQVDVISLCAETEEEKKIWVRALKRALYADKGGALFSQSLQEILYWERAENRRIPYIVDECVEYLYKYGLDVEGIFRLPGRQSAIKDIIARFERGEKIRFEDESVDVHVVASVLKTFLRDLPDSIIPCKFYQKVMNIALRFMDSSDAEVKAKCTDELAECMKLIPEDNYVILKYVCRFLREVGLREASNKMSMMSLGTVFGYNIIRHIDKENSQLFLCTADLGQNLVYMLLEYFPKVFMLEYSDKGDTANNVPTGDLLRMSRVLDIPSVIPDRPFIRPDLLGLNLNLNSTSSPTPSSGRGSHSSLSVSDDYHLANSCAVKDTGEDVDSNDNVFFSQSDIDDVVIRSKKLQLRIPEPHDSSDPGSINLRDGNPPIPPRRKSRVLRNRNVERRDVDGERSPISPAVLNPDDVMMALANVPSNANISSPSLTKKSPDASNLSLAPALNGSAGNLKEIVPEKEAPCLKVYEEDGKVGPTTNELRIQVTALKEELTMKRDRYKEQVNALKNQLTDMKEKYERRIETMQVEFNSQKQELEKNLALEKSSHLRTISQLSEAKELLGKYQSKYGQFNEDSPLH
ncbi:rho GTPase-activating protein 25-like [Physella acuta]|uniref:rho GTPase-activating protein 25-like n=1 Tax=Physella acuta TaxID=109671 RepID=UPI0027DDBBD1|nr:rho GTPase-activating protein 25-like [Physella acuta]XP_059177124.1 rho GTPase-activating protein 25-like [Physella acuta]